MLLQRRTERLLLSPTDLEPLRGDFEVVGVFNPGAVRVDGEVILHGAGGRAAARAPPGVYRAAALVSSGAGPGDRLAS